MAVFTPQAENISPEAPTSVGGGLGGLEVAAKLFGAGMQDRTTAPTASQADAARRASLVKSLETVRATLDEGDTSRAIAESKNVIAGYVASGGSWNDEARSVASSITGLPPEQFGMTQAELDRASAFDVRQARMEDPAFIATMTLVARENPSLEGDAIYAAASNRFEERLANEQLLLEAQTTGQVDWEAGVRTAMVARTDEFVTTSLGAFIDQSGQFIPIDPADLAAVKGQWMALRGTALSRPTNVTNEQWAVMQDKFTQVDSMFSNLEKIISSDFQKERLQSFTQQLISGFDLGEATPEQVMTALLASDDISTFITMSYGAGAGAGFDAAGFFQTNPTFVNDIMKRVELNLDNQQKAEFEATLPRQPDGIVDPNGTLSYDQLPDSIKQQVEGLDEDALLSSLRVDGMTIAGVSSSSLTDPTQANSFTNQATRLGTWLLSTDGRPLSAAEVRNLGLGSNLGEKLDIIANIGTDDGAEETARIVLRSGLTTQIALQSARVESITNSPAFNIRGATYDKESGTLTFTNQGEITRMVALLQGYDSSKVAQIRSMSPEYFDAEGNLVIPATVGANEPSWLSNVRRSLPSEYRDVVAYNETIDTLTAARDSLSVDVPADQAAPAEVGTYRLPQEVAADTEFLAAVNSTSTNLGINQDDLLRIIEFETAGSWSPSVKAPTSSATGLIQFIESTAQGLGTSTADLAQMSRAEQMQYVEKYLEPYKGRINNFGDLYMAVHWPAGVGKEDNYVMYERGSAAYDANRSLDTNGDGTVTRGETLGRVMSATGNGRGVMTTPNTATAEASINTGNAAASLPQTQTQAAPEQTSTLAPMTSPAPTARPADMGQPVEADLTAPFQTKIQGEARTGDQGIIRADNSTNYSREIQTLLRNIGVNPSQTFVVADEAELQDAVNRGILKTGDKVLVGEGADSFVVEIN